MIKCAEVSVQAWRRERGESHVDNHDFIRSTSPAGVKHLEEFSLARPATRISMLKTTSEKSFVFCPLEGHFRGHIIMFYQLQGPFR